MINIQLFLILFNWFIIWVILEEKHCKLSQLLKASFGSSDTMRKDKTQDATTHFLLMANLINIFINNSIILVFSDITVHKVINGVNTCQIDHHNV